MNILQILRGKYPEHEMSGWHVADNLQGAGPELVVWREAVMGRPRPTTAELAAWNDELAPVFLDSAKTARIAAVDLRTQELIAEGFAFAGKRFSMSEAAQRNWIALSSGLANGMLPFPMAVSTVDEHSHVLAAANDLKAFLGAYMVYQADPAQPLGSGRALKERITAATTIEELDAIADDR